MSGDINRLVDNGHCVALFKNGLGTYTAFAVPQNYPSMIDAMEFADDNGHLTDDFTADKALARLADKVNSVGDYQA